MHDTFEDLSFGIHFTCELLYHYTQNLLIIPPGGYFMSCAAVIGTNQGLPKVSIMTGLKKKDPGM